MESVLRLVYLLQIIDLSYNLLPVFELLLTIVRITIYRLNIQLNKDKNIRPVFSEISCKQLSNDCQRDSSVCVCLRFRVTSLKSRVFSRNL